MNWKINYWTILTLFLAGSLILSCMDTNGDAADARENWRGQIADIDTNVKTILELVASNKNCNSDPDTIKRDVARKRIVAHNKLMDAIGKTSKVKLPVNWGKGYLRLPHCETRKMMESDPNADVLIFLTIEEDPNDASQTMLSAVLRNTDFLETEAASAEALLAEAGNGSFFDFIKPCPPTCPD